MVSQTMGMLRAVERQYASQGDLPFEQIIGEFGAGDDDSLAELIEADGRARLALGKRVDLRRYLKAVPDLEARRVPLDAAIDVTLRSLSASSRPTPEAVRTLVDGYPHLAASIQDAATLAEALWSTTGLRARVQGPTRPVPADFGPRLASGARRYELKRLLGKGGWGEVYLAADRQLSDNDREATVAIKVLTGERGPWARQRLIDEATKARRIDHPAVVRVLDRGVSDEDEDYIVYEHVEGGDLAEWLEGRSLTPRAAARLVAKIARGVQAAHGALLVHCDLKPGNILMTRGDEPKVADFGIAVRRGEGLDAVRERNDGRPVGNIAFISPEQFRMEDGSLSVAADLYALGGILYFMITREFPNGSSADEIARNHDPVEGRTAPPSLRDSRARGIDRDLDAICQRAMAVDARHRYLSAGALANDLEAWVGRRPVEWLERGRLRRSAMWCQRRPALAAMTAAAVAAVVMGTGGSLYWGRIASLRASEATESATKIQLALDRMVRLADVPTAWAESGFDFDLLPIAVVMEWANAQQVLGDALDPAERWRSRVEILRRMLEERQSGPLVRSVETLMWQSVLGLWLLNSGQIEEAEAVVDENLRRWREVLKSDEDPWVQFMRRIKAMVVVRRVQGRVGHGPFSPEERAELEGAADVLEECLKSPAKPTDRGAVQQLVLVTLMDVDGPDMLDRPRPYQEAYARVMMRLFNQKDRNPHDPLWKAIKKVEERGNGPTRPASGSP